MHPPVVLLQRSVLRQRVLHDQLGRGAGVPDAVLGHAGEGAGVLGEDLLDDERGLVVVVVVDLQSVQQSRFGSRFAFGIPICKLKFKLGLK